MESPLFEEPHAATPPAIARNVGTSLFMERSLARLGAREATIERIGELDVVGRERFDSHVVLGSPPELLAVHVERDELVARAAGHLRSPD